jgi:hypothetical protein
MGRILFTDGTCLYLRVYRKEDRKPLAPKPAYKTLISDCVRHGVNSVAALPKRLEKP